MGPPFFFLKMGANMTESDIELALDIGRASVLLLGIIAGAVVAGALKGRWFVLLLALGLVGSAKAYQDTYLLWVPIPAVTVGGVNYPSCTVPAWSVLSRYVPPSTYITLKGYLPSGWSFATYPGGDVGFYNTSTGVGYHGHAITVTGYSSAFRMWDATYAGGSGNPVWVSSTNLGICAFIRQNMTDGGTALNALPELTNNPRFCDYTNGVYKTRPSLASGPYSLNQLYRNGEYIGTLGGVDDASLWASIGANGAIMAGSPVTGTGVWVRASADDYGAWQVESPLTSATPPAIPAGALGEWVRSSSGSGLLGPSGIQSIWGWVGTAGTSPGGVEYIDMKEYVMSLDGSITNASPLQVGAVAGMSYGQGATLIDWEKTASLALRADLNRQHLEMLAGVGEVKTAIESIDLGGGGGVSSGGVSEAFDYERIEAMLGGITSSVNQAGSDLLDFLTRSNSAAASEWSTNNIDGGAEADAKSQYGEFSNTLFRAKEGKVISDVLYNAVIIFPVVVDKDPHWYSNSIPVPLVGDVPVYIDLTHYPQLVTARAWLVKALVFVWTFAMFKIFCKVTT
jgi:hypothetical protein